MIAIVHVHVCVWGWVGERERENEEKRREEHLIPVYLLYLTEKLALYNCPTASEANLIYHIEEIA